MKTLFIFRLLKNKFVDLIKIFVGKFIIRNSIRNRKMFEKKTFQVLFLGYDFSNEINDNQISICRFPGPWETLVG